VHLYGFSLDLDHLQRLRERFDVRIVEDCAQSILSTWNGRPTGSVGQIAATSFYPTKNLGALGDGGALLTGDRRLAEEAAYYRDYGQTAKYEHTRLGCNSRLDELHAAILRTAILPRLADWTCRRRAIAAQYQQAISNPRIRVPHPNAAQTPCGHLFPVFVDPAHKPDLLQHLRAHAITAAEHYPRCIFEQEALRALPFEVLEGCKNAIHLCRSEISLPIHPWLTQDEVATIVSACNEWRDK
jgi:dTDP-3-amino-3,4,6-trideoxy-alpha-D-glucose transaminase